MRLCLGKDTFCLIIEHMRCEACGLRTSIKQSWEAGRVVKRTHQCDNPDCPRCGEDFRFTTTEKVDADSAGFLRSKTDPDFG